MDFRVGSIIQAKSNGIKAKVLFINKPANIIQIEYVNPPVANYFGVHAYCLSDFVRHWVVDSNSQASSADTENISLSNSKKECLHHWMNYEGFIENYKFCSKCDIKQNNS